MSSDPYSSSFVLGTGQGIKSDGFSEKLQRAFDPAPSFSENNVANCLGKRLKEPI